MATEQESGIIGKPHPHDHANGALENNERNIAVRGKNEGLDFQQQYDLLPWIRVPSLEEKGALKKRGIIFLPAGTQSLDQMTSEDPGYFKSNTPKYLIVRPLLMEYVLPAPIWVGLNPEQPAIPCSFNKSQKEQLGIIQDLSWNLQQEFPDARAVILPAVALALIDRAYFEQTGQPLFKNFYARALDQVSGLSAAHVGRDDHPDARLNVHEWATGLGFANIAAALTIVFIQKQGAGDQTISSDLL
ncbi:MAG: hypothetical protein A3C27_02085 [Candidatus Levybacteria bacterium RIFCSPHIGHO2_02_FULL_39_36]|nr:MAG: hypothetical protein UT20_C0029G0014 [Candidatus Levybacteria bacterium GW2011_GWA1_39_11]KKR24290.1 MAG: hypothetical protein UT56_C0020G0004 [Candidatus Levybacteria bacterium GW2011_GWB1_39_7]KKR48164.1 MAG: hypothetical protein UT85_C0038G0016 [Candidatus Levybacteria bacterium GW2011_GWA2_40_16]OGH25837.1 MAG: hypothetical protein A3E68_00895 [Candidatus Levybacteria bacterium RIFCSPHIGHO2_12_FULL_39_39]OGH27598.1 MAG: hypothetical protein A3C27_02085 [Candidatus Levybacteria bacte